MSIAGTLIDEGNTGILLFNLNLLTLKILYYLLLDYVLMGENPGSFVQWGIVECTILLKMMKGY